MKMISNHLPVTFLIRIEFQNQVFITRLIINGIFIAQFKFFGCSLSGMMEHNGLSS